MKSPFSTFVGKTSFFGSLCLFNWGCFAVQHPPEIPANEVSPDISYLWPEEKTLIKTNEKKSTQFENKTAVGVNNGIIAVVNNRLITLKEFFNEFRYALEKKSYFEKEHILYESVLNGKINDLLLLELAYEKEILIEPERIEREINDIAKRHPKGWDGMRRDLEKDKSSIEAYKENIKEFLMRKRIESEIVGYLNDPSPRDVQENYQKNISKYQTADKRSISLITIFNSDYKNDKKLIDRASKKIKERLEKEDFNKVLISMSEDGKGDGGIKGFITQSDLAEPIGKVAFGQLEQGKWSGPHAMPGITFFVKCVEIQPKQTQPLSEVQAQISREMIREIKINKINKALEDIREASYIRKMTHKEYMEYIRSLSQ